MEHAINTLSNKTPRMESSLVESVFAIIDSRIQYLEYQNDKRFKSYFKNKEQEDIVNLELQKSQSLLNNFEDFLTHLSSSSKSIKKLLFLRNSLLIENAGLVLDLLTDDHYLRFTEERLNLLLDKRSVS